MENKIKIVGVDDEKHYLNNIQQQVENTLGDRLENFEGFDKTVEFYQALTSRKIKQFILIIDFGEFAHFFHLLKELKGKTFMPGDGVFHNVAVDGSEESIYKILKTRYQIISTIMTTGYGRRAENESRSDYWKTCYELAKDGFIYKPDNNCNLSVLLKNMAAKGKF